LKTIRHSTVAFVCLLLLLSQCGSHDHGAAGSEHDPGETHRLSGPHGGALVILDDERSALLEVVVDAELGTLSAYVLDDHAEDYVRISQQALRIRVEGGGGRQGTVELPAFASSLTGEKVGDTSQFQGASELLIGLVTFKGTLEKIEYRGRVSEGIAFLYPEGHDTTHVH